MIKLLGLSAVLLLVAACQKSAVPSESLAPPISPQHADFRKASTRVAEAYELQSLLQTSLISCEEGACPEAVGAYIAWEPMIDKKNKVWSIQCTGALVASDIVQTASHCIPDRVKAKPELCATTIGIKFPASGSHAEEIATCSELIQTSWVPSVAPGQHQQILPEEQDFAYFRISQPSARLPLTIARRGVRTETTLNIYAADPIIHPPDPKDPEKSFPVEAIFRKKTCVAKQQTQFFAIYSNDFANTVAAFGDACLLKKGNSGSPVLDENNQLVAIFYGADEHLLEKVMRYMKEQNIVGSSQLYEHTASMLNLSCLNLSRQIGAEAPAAECAREAELQKLGEKLAQDSMDGLAREKIQADDAKWKKLGPALLRPEPVYSDSTNDLKQMLYARDFKFKCLLPKEYWPQAHAEVSQNVLTVKYTAPIYIYQWQMESSGKLREVPISTQMRQGIVSINTSLVGTSDSVVGTRSLDGVSQTFSTHWCSNQELVQESR